MTTQPDALRLAEDRPTSLNDDLYQWAIDAEDTLRRLHAVNVDLLVALHCISLASVNSGCSRYGMGKYARAAIAKAKGKQK